MSSRGRPRALVFAYACEPSRGSEPGAGWGLMRAVSEFADCVVLTAPEHLPAIRKWEAANPNSQLSFIEVPESRIARYAKWHRIPWFLVYVTWLRRAAAVARQLHRERPFQVVHHATYSTYWLPSPVVGFGIPAVWGPVGGGVTTPVRLWSLLGWQGILDEVLDASAVRLASWWPATRATWRRAPVPILQNEESLERLPPAVRGRARVLNHALFVEMPTVVRRKVGSYLLHAGGLESRKGPVLALRALTHADATVRLVMLGDGPERRHVERVAATLGLRDRVEFPGRVPREQVLEYLAGATAALFTGLREEGGLALAEAMMLGTPVIVLSNGGARTVAASATDPRRVVLVEPAGVEETARRLGAAINRCYRDPPARCGALIDQEVARSQLRAAFEDALS